MATAAGEIDLDSYTQLPLHMDPASKILSVPPTTTTTTTTTSSSDRTSLQETLDTINNLHANLKTIEGPNSNNNTSILVPPAPAATNVTTQRRTAHINKLRESASLAFRKSQFQESIRLYSFAIDGAAGRPSWEPVALIREELSGLHRDRALAYMAVRAWVEAYKDCEVSVECRRPQGSSEGKGGGGDSKGGRMTGGTVWWRGARCLMEMSRYKDTVTWLERGFDCEGGGNMHPEDRKEMMVLWDEARKKV